jgi:hypothetical protein
MKTTLGGGFVCAGLLVGILLGAQVVSAQIISFPVGGFTTSNVCKNSATPPPACQILTDGSPSLPTVVTGGILRLTTANQNQHGATKEDPQFAVAYSRLGEAYSDLGYDAKNPGGERR